MDPSQAQKVQNWIAKHVMSCPNCRTLHPRNVDHFSLPPAPSSPGVSGDMIGVTCAGCAHVAFFSKKAMGL